jgi:hypothetical protein
MHVYTSLKWNFQLLVREIHPLNLNSMLGQFQGASFVCSWESAHASYQRYVYGVWFARIVLCNNESPLE